jgi:hypothetical protein
MLKMQNASKSWEQPTPPRGKHLRFATWKKQNKTRKNQIKPRLMFPLPHCFFLFYLVLFCFFKPRPAVIARFAVYVCDATRISVRSALPLATEGTQE